MADKDQDQVQQPLIKEAEAVVAPKGNAATSQRFKALLLFMMVVQNSSTVLVGRHTRSSVDKADLYSVNHLIMTCELLKVRIEDYCKYCCYYVLLLYAILPGEQG